MAYFPDIQLISYLEKILTDPLLFPRRDSFILSDNIYVPCQCQVLLIQA